MVLRSIALVAFLAGGARADETPPQPTAQPEPAPIEVDWSKEPRPDEASGVERAEKPPATDRLLWIPRAILFVPRWALWGFAQPARGGAYVYERYDVLGLWRRTFWNDAETFGIYPIVSYETGLGIEAGGRLVHRDLFGEHEQLRLRANVGGNYRQAYGLNLRSGDRIPHVGLEYDASYARRPNEPFYGIGDGAVDGEMRFRENMIRSLATVEVPLVDALSFRLSNALVYRELMGTSVDNTRVEGELVYDSRRATSIYASPVVDSTGWYASMHAGATRGIGSDSSHFADYGGEVQRFFDLYRGTRVLALRVLVETIDDGPASFIDLPQLGGTEFLRGYPRGRFRDRALTLATAEYTWDLGNFFAAYTFVDAGRVWPSLRDVTLDDIPRVGYGFGFQLHTSTSYIGRVQIAGSRDGDVGIELVLSPAFPRRERIGRY